MNHIEIFLAALFNENLDEAATINALRLVLRKPLLEKGGRDGGATGERKVVDKTILQYVRAQAAELNNEQQ